MRIKRALSIAAVVGMVSVFTIPAAGAALGDKDPACQRGADNHRVSPWQLMEKQDLIDLGAPPAVADGYWAFNDHNRDGYLCVMFQYLPNDANGSQTWVQLEDNHYEPS